MDTSQQMFSSSEAMMKTIPKMGIDTDPKNPLFDISRAQEFCQPLIIPKVCVCVSQKACLILQKAPGTLSYQRGDRAIALNTNYIGIQHPAKDSRIYMYDVEIEALIDEDKRSIKNLQKRGADE
jgi:hypothetical protein